MAKKKRKTSRTLEDDLQLEELRRRVQERIAYHEEMSILLKEREREQATLERLRREAAGS